MPAALVGGNFLIVMNLQDGNPSFLSLIFAFPSCFPFAYIVENLYNIQCANIVPLPFVKTKIEPNYPVKRQ